MSEEGEVHQVLLRMTRERLLLSGFRYRSGEWYVSGHDGFVHRTPILDDFVRGVAAVGRSLAAAADRQAD
jgi:hypothetical protein